MSVSASHDAQRHRAYRARALLCVMLPAAITYGAFGLAAWKRGASWPGHLPLRWVSAHGFAQPVQNQSIATLDVLMHCAAGTAVQVREIQAH